MKLKLCALWKLKSILDFFFQWSLASYFGRKHFCSEKLLPWIIRGIRNLCLHNIVSFCNQIHSSKFSQVSGHCTAVTGPDIFMCTWKDLNDCTHHCITIASFRPAVALNFQKQKGKCAKTWSICDLTLLNSILVFCQLPLLEGPVLY